ncbi:type 1 glutamine amidotransferase [Caryophanon latum]|uniref:Glutamine amidotransferase domain-containing protein n=1 Tax=Caryophanon latum TaxID=33977 RepID=A0A1C0YU84_9BACL|nr:type 1 glutamine amidotransferase [Caryophanon latum]OCS90727.1 hypothetical protein A6K76_01360 [Caryophanon latum]
MKTIFLQHAPYWHGGVLHTIIDGDIIHAYDNPIYPDLDDVGLIIVLGGPQSANEQEAWLNREKAFLKEAIDAKRPILAIGLGAQLIASIIGGIVYPNHAGKEIGYFPVEPAIRPLPFGLFPETLRPFHFHQQAFTLPPGAMVFYRTVYCEQQAFLHTDRVIGLQFHLELDESLRHALLQHEGAFFTVDGYFTMTKEQVAAAPIDPSHHALIERIVRHLQTRLRFM